MTRDLTVFVDSDVIISSLISKSGALYLLLNKTDLKLFISNYSSDELKVVAKRLGIVQKRLDTLIKMRFKAVRLKASLDRIKIEYNDYVKDAGDAHIIAGAVKSGARFLISYNLRDFRTDRIKRDFGLICLKPAQLLQYLRSL